MSDVTVLSGISRLSFDSHTLFPLLCFVCCFSCSSCSFCVVIFLLMVHSLRDWFCGIYFRRGLCYCKKSTEVYVCL